MEGAGRFVSTLAKGGRVQVHGRISFEGSLGEYGKESDEEGSRKTAENDRGDCGGGYGTNEWVSDRHASKKRVKARRTLWVIPCMKNIGVLFQSQEGRSDHSKQCGLKRR